MLTMFGWNFYIEERCKGLHCVDLGESFPKSICMYLLAKFGFDTAESEPSKVGTDPVYPDCVPENVRYGRSRERDRAHSTGEIWCGRGGAVRRWRRRCRLDSDEISCAKENPALCGGPKFISWSSKNVVFEINPFFIWNCKSNILIFLHFSQTSRQHLICWRFSCFLQQWFRLNEFSVSSPSSFKKKHLGPGDCAPPPLWATDIFFFRNNSVFPAQRHDHRKNVLAFEWRSPPADH